MYIQPASYKLRVQCYDDASTMHGHESSVAAIILAVEQHVLYVHFYGYFKILASWHSIRSTKMMKDAMETAHEMMKLIHFSRPHENFFFAHRETQMVTKFALFCVSRVQHVE